MPNVLSYIQPIVNGGGFFVAVHIKEFIMKKVYESPKTEIIDLGASFLSASGEPGDAVVYDIFSSLFGKSF